MKYNGRREKIAPNQGEMTLSSRTAFDSVLDQFDVAVVGGGVAGVVAALAAQRNGVKTVLIERYGFLGGMATAAMVAPMVTFHSRRGEQVITGIPQEIVDALTAMGGSVGHVRDTIGVAGSVTPNDPETLKYLLHDLIQKAGVKVILHTLATDLIFQESGLPGIRGSGASADTRQSTGSRQTMIHGLVLENKGGKALLRASMFIDCTGDGDLAYKGGVPYSVGSDGSRLGQPMTLIFRMGGVDIDAIITYMLSHREEFHHETLFEELRSVPAIGVSGFFSVMKEAVANGEISVPRDRLLFFSTLTPGEVLVNTTRVMGKDPLDPWELSLAELEGKEQMYSLVKFLKRRVPGFKHSYLSASAPQIGVRETRRIRGEYVLTEEDVLKGRDFPDGIAKGAFAVDIHDPGGKGIISKNIEEGGSYDIPYRCLLPLGVENLLLAGRCISTTHQAFSSTRVQATSMAVGQAAGTAAALSFKQEAFPRNLDVSLLRSTLERQGATVR